MVLPLRLRIKASATLLKLQLGGHALMGVPVLLLGEPWLIGVLAAMLGGSCCLVWHRVRHPSAELTLYADGTLEMHGRERQPLLCDSRVWPLLVALKQQGVPWMLLMPDSCDDAECWRRLQVWVRWAGAAGAVRASSGVAE